MKKYFILLILIIFNFSYGFSQKRIDFNIYGSFLYPSRFYISQNYIDPDFNYPNKGKVYFKKEYKEYTNKTESSVPSFSVGFNFSKHISKRINIQFGLEYSQISEKKDITYIEKLGYFYENVILIAHDSYVIYNFNNLTLPLGISYEWLQSSKIHISPSLSINLDWVVNSSIDNNPNDSLNYFHSKFESNYYKYNKLTGSLSFGIEISYSFTANFKFFIKPLYNQSIIANWIYTDKYYSNFEFHSRDIIKRFNYYFGIQTGIGF